MAAVIRCVNRLNIFNNLCKGIETGPNQLLDMGHDCEVLQVSTDDILSERIFEDGVESKISSSIEEKQTTVQGENTMSGVWQRPEGEFPRVWLREKGFVIRDLTPDLQPYFVEHMVTNFGRDEPLNKSSGLTKEPEGIKDLKKLWNEFCFPQRVSIVALAEGEPGADLKPVSAAKPPRILGGNILTVSHKDDPPSPPIEESFNTAKFKKVIGTIGEIGELENIFEKYNVDCYMDAMGLSVCPSTRGHGLGLLIVKARLALCQGLGIPVTKTVFTNIASQKIGERAGFELLAERDYEDIKDERGEVKFPDMEGTKSIKLMARRTSPLH